MRFLIIFHSYTQMLSPLLAQIQALISWTLFSQLRNAREIFWSRKKEAAAVDLQRSWTAK